MYALLTLLLFFVSSRYFEIMTSIELGGLRDLPMDDKLRLYEKIIIQGDALDSLRNLSF